ncbi:MAG: hypothetical protein Fur002_25730 [Anaerolineales bacterium]
MKRSFIFIFAFLLISCANAQPAANAPASSGSVLFQDDFSSPLSGFDHFMSPEGIMDYDGGGYRILVNALQTNFWATPRKNFSNVRIEVDSGKLGGPDENRIGLLCRYSENNYYFFLITSDGYYGAGIFFNGQALLLGQDEMQFSESIQRGAAVNHLRADCVGSTLAFYVNGVPLASIQNDALASGDVGMIAGTFNQPGADVVFDNFIVFQP